MSATVSSLLTISLSVLFFFFGVIQDFLLKHSLTYYLSKTYVLFFIMLAPAVYLFIKKPEAKKLLKFLSAFLLFFCISEVILLLYKVKNFNETPRLTEKVVLNKKQKTNSDSFNIYHIIFDGYTNSATLQKEFGFYNSIDSFLRDHHFYVAGKTKSNYNFTPYSLASTLQLCYLELSVEQLERTYKNYLSGNQLYRDNVVFNFFKESGYEVHSFSILEDYEHLNKLGTFVPKTPAFSIRSKTLERIILNPWLWHKLTAKKESLPESVKKSLHNYIEYNQKALANVLSQVGNQLVFNFTHFLLPHEPYVYRRAALDSLIFADVMDHRQGYIMQVQYVNGLIKNVVTELQKNKKNIIIIQGDHGFREYGFPSVLTQLETFNAFYFPNQDYHLLYDSISLVNTYRIVLKQYFQQEVPLLKDQYFIPSR